MRGVRAKRLRYLRSLHLDAEPPRRLRKLEAWLRRKGL
jgi:hypothetical protein